MKKTLIAATLGLVFTATAFADNSVAEVNNAKQQALVEIKQAKEQAIKKIKDLKNKEHELEDKTTLETKKTTKEQMTEKEFSDFVNTKFTNYGGVNVLRSLDKFGLEGFYEVKLGGRDTGVMDSTGEFFIVGSLIQFKDGTHKNLTSEYEAQMMSKNAETAVKSMSEDEMITFTPKGEKIGTAYVFTDTTCGYCRKLHGEIDELLEGGVEVKYIAYPRAGFEEQVPVGRDPKTSELIMGDNKGLVELSQVFCADDQQQALTDVKNGVAGNKYNTENYKESKESCNKKVEKGYKTGQKVGFSGTPFIYLSNGKSIPGYNPAPQIIKSFKE